MRLASPPVEAPPHASEHPAAIAPEGPTSRRLLPAALVALLVGLVVFLVIQALLGLYDIQVIRDASARGLVDGYSLSLRDRLWPALIHGVMGYLIVATVGVAIAGKGHRLLFAIPAAAYVLTDFVVGPVHQPEPIGTAWGIECFSMNGFCSGPWFAHAWIGSVVDLALVALPGPSSRFGCAPIDGPASPTRPRSRRSSSL
jgi:hypothetical protein